MAKLIRNAKSQSPAQRIPTAIVEKLEQVVEKWIDIQILARGTGWLQAVNRDARYADSFAGNKRRPPSALMLQKSRRERLMG